MFSVPDTESVYGMQFPSAYSQATSNLAEHQGPLLADQQVSSKTCTNYSCSQGPYKHQAPLSISGVSFSFNKKILNRMLVFWVRRL